jgi:hypothetical protein
MLTGANRYLAFDAVPHARAGSNLTALESLVELFAQRTSIPGENEFPEITPRISSLDFPYALLCDELLERTLRPERVASIRRALTSAANGRASGCEGIDVRYTAPWHDAAEVNSGSVDLVLSQAVLEHVNDIDLTYHAMFDWLRPGGVMSHTIDFRSHGLTRDWFGHWTIPMWEWRLIRGRRPYLINRQPASVHVQAIKRAGFNVSCVVPSVVAPAPRDVLAAEFQWATDDDLATSAMFVIARKPMP